MLARAKERQNELQIKNLAFLHADAQTHLFEPERFDLIFSRFGAMFFADPIAAFTNLCTALRPDGRLCFLCWQALEKNEWIRIPLMAAARHIQLPPPPAPGTPGPLSLADPERVRSLLAASGFQDINFAAYETAVSLGGATSVEEAVDFALAIGPTAMLLRDADPSVRTRVAQAIREALTPYVTPNGLSLHGAAWIIRARSSR
jgi:SAM-dependent methyltransferase